LNYFFSLFSLNVLAPLQALFLAPCAHAFHYKCVTPLLQLGVMFQCPLCRQVANLDAGVSTETGWEDNEMSLPSSSSPVEIVESQALSDVQNTSSIPSTTNLENSRLDYVTSLDVAAGHTLGRSDHNLSNSTPISSVESKSLPPSSLDERPSIGGLVGLGVGLDQSSIITAHALTVPPHFNSESSSPSQFQSQSLSLLSHLSDGERHQHREGEREGEGDTHHSDTSSSSDTPMNPHLISQKSKVQTIQTKPY